MQRADEPAHVLEVAGAAVALGEVRLEADAFGLGQRAVEVVGHELDELAAHERVADLVAASPAHQRLTSINGMSAARTRARARCSSTRWLTSVSPSSSQTSTEGAPRGRAA